VGTPAAPATLEAGAGGMPQEFQASQGKSKTPSQKNKKERKEGGRKREEGRMNWPGLQGAFGTPLGLLSPALLHPAGCRARVMGSPVWPGSCSLCTQPGFSSFSR
jgi:hypothetical protein